MRYLKELIKTQWRKLLKSFGVMVGVAMALTYVMPLTDEPYLTEVSKWVIVETFCTLAFGRKQIKKIHNEIVQNIIGDGAIGQIGENEVTLK